ncbi:hypothetical protein ETU08_00235 [Apibacter muscae]|uniref:hypothetical protein n=1 Tax=Apibacter muscae TaxID=2509004 RepID=UPI0011ADDA1C|nr:hypothetical protein [Apibacter muscae]TWP23101.1 hypothetical protein ETU10_08375 [Apibacter muscae]TWP31921.1 hypothetical protein ETU08_00235 [Apibacter muscae]
MKLTNEVIEKIRTDISLRYAISEKVGRSERGIYNMAYRVSDTLPLIVKSSIRIIEKHTGLKESEIFEKEKLKNR